VEDANKTIYSDEHTRFIATINSIRKAKNITQEQIAISINKPQSFVSKCLSGQRRIDVVEWLWFCKALKISPETFLRKFKFNI